MERKKLKRIITGVNLTGLTIMAIGYLIYAAARKMMFAGELSFDEFSSLLSLSRTLLTWSILILMTGFGGATLALATKEEDGEDEKDVSDI